MNMIGQVGFVQLKQCEWVMNACMIQIIHSFISAAGLEVQSKAWVSLMTRSTREPTASHPVPGLIQQM